MKLRYIIDDLILGCYEYSVEHFININNKIKSQILRYAIYLCFLPYFLIRWATLSIYVATFGKVKISEIIRKEKNKKFENDIAIVAIAKNESKYIREWCAYYIAIGVKKIYIYDNESTDNMYSKIDDFIEKGLVEYIYYSGKNQQIPAYNDAIHRYKLINRYMAFVDLDEFLVPTKEENLFDCIERIINKVSNAGGIGVNWSLYGSSGFVNNQNRLVTATFNKRGYEKQWPNYHVKTICNPRLVKNYISPHFPIYKLGAWNIDSMGGAPKAMV